jgi:hypothetical protein
MASNSNRKITFAKLKRENDVRERRERKQARRQARRDSAAPPDAPGPRGDQPAREREGTPRTGPS